SWACTTRSKAETEPTVARWTVPRRPLEMPGNRRPREMVAASQRHVSGARYRIRLTGRLLPDIQPPAVGAVRQSGCGCTGTVRTKGDSRARTPSMTDVAAIRARHADGPFIAACNGQPHDTVPVWFMRQAG